VPLYEYQCGKCGRFEVIQKFSDALLTVCPTCGQEVQKLLSAPAIQFKGTGWYITDYARKGGSGSTASSSGDSSTSADSSKSSDSTSSPQTSTSKDSSASGSSSSK
jgi:putative FmdB family regulatory protein